MSISSPILGAVGGLLLVACWTDMSSLRIPNWIPAGIAGLYALYALGLPLDEIFSHIVASVVILIGGLGLFAWGKLGGGDVKLLAGISLWVGWGLPLLNLLLAISLLGAVVSLIVLTLRTRIVAALLRGNGYHLVILDPKTGAPYALAIAGGFFLISLVPS